MKCKILDGAGSAASVALFNKMELRKAINGTDRDKLLYAVARVLSPYWRDYGVIAVDPFYVTDRIVRTFDRLTRAAQKVST